MADYITLDELRGYLKFDAPDNAAVGLLITRVARFIDSYTLRAGDAFAAAPTVATARTFYGDGTDRLIVGSHVGAITSITLPEGHAPVGTEFIDEGKYLRRTVNGRVVPLSALYGTERLLISTDAPYPFLLSESIGWSGGINAFPRGVPVTVTARWGFAEIPPDIKEAALQLCVRWWRGKDDAFSGVIGSVNTDATVIERGLPEAAKRILDLYRDEGAITFA